MPCRSVITNYRLTKGDLFCRFVRFLKLEEAKKVISAWDGAMYKEQRLLVEMSRHDLHAAANSQDAGECVSRVMFLHVFFLSSHNVMVWLLLKMSHP